MKPFFLFLIFLLLVTNVSALTIQIEEKTYIETNKSTNLTVHEKTEPLDNSKAISVSFSEDPFEWIFDNKLFILIWGYIIYILVKMVK